MGPSPSDLIGAADLDIPNLIAGLGRIATQQHGDDLSSSVNQLRSWTRELPWISHSDNFEEFHNRVTQWVDRAGPMLDDIDAALRELRRQASIGAQSTP
jgi:hypothetical protein